MSKFKEGGGLGISLEGTVDVEYGREVRPHHYIRSILNDGPVGINHKLRPGDELFEVRDRSYITLFIFVTPPPKGVTLKSNFIIFFNV